ncbi:D-alanyl-D-alanine carboxypeptidase family protein [Candidatus Clostridium radicumherbarum]|uniref:serine-type D-Ala-D-Ala carboxypeptidase n=1 Tax=Candidatus Clostridium radicumherbarum TaxID=3381662 RepID=A0ABW8TW56_9CLOT
MKSKKNKFISLFLVCSLIIFNFVSIKVNAMNINVNARAAVAIDSRSKVVLYEKNAHMLIPMASTTKIMTALVALKYGDLDKKFEISSKASAIRGSTVGYKKGDMISLKELIYGLMLRSGNDAAIAIAEGIGGSVEGFVRIMNEYANQIGLCSTNFESPHGLDSENHYCNAYDLALITIKAREDKLFNEIVATKDLDKKDSDFTRSYHNINKILWLLPESSGVKTGYTGKAGKCLVSSVEIQNNDVIIVVLNSPERWKETKKIYDYINKNYDYKQFFSKEEVVDEFNINRSSKVLKLTTEKEIILPVNKDKNYEVKITKPTENIKLPIVKGTKLGGISIYEGDKKIYTNYLIAGNDIKAKKWFFFK